MYKQSRGVLFLSNFIFIFLTKKQWVAAKKYTAKTPLEAVWITKKICYDSATYPTLCCTDTMNAKWLPSSLINTFFAFTITLFITATMTTVMAAQSHAEEASCEIEGTATQWASDACLWQYETDNINNHKVQQCIKRADQYIQLLNECDAKRLFKQVICKKTSKWNINDNCLTSTEPLGPTTSLNKH